LSPAVPASAKLGASSKAKQWLDAAKPWLLLRIGSSTSHKKL
jgi:hypothetical protein